MSNVKRLVAVLALSALVVGGLAGCLPGKQPVSAKFRVAVVFPGPINDAGWNESGYKGMLQAKEKLGVETAYTENVPPAEFESVIRDYADKKYDLLIAHGFEFTDAIKKVAPTALKTQFAIINGRDAQAPNVAAFRFNTPQIGFLAGSFAGLMTKSNVVGMIGGMKYPHIVDSLNAFEAGAKYVNPNVKTLTAWVESWTDIPKGKELALAMIDQKADYLTANANQVGLGCIEAAKQRGIKYVGYVGDQNAVAPDTVVVSIIQSVGNMMIHIIKNAQAKTIEPKLHLLGANDGVVFLSPYHNHENTVPASVKAKMTEIYAGIKDGSLLRAGVLPRSVFDK